MPISGEEWKAGRRGVPWLTTIFDFLDDGYPKAYLSSEIAKELFDIDESNIESAIFVLFVASQLEILMDRGVVEAKSVDNDEYEGMTYYRRAEDVNSLDR